MSALPKPSLFDSVMPAWTDTKRLNWWGRLLCPHKRFTNYTRIDHRAGPGAFADTYKGIACRDCSKIIEEKLT